MVLGCLGQIIHNVDILSKAVIMGFVSKFYPTYTNNLKLHMLITGSKRMTIFIWIILIASKKSMLFKMN